MCPSTAEGGRCCPGAPHASINAQNTPPARPASSYAEADAELRAAQDAVHGGPAPVVGGVPSTLTGAIARGGDADGARRMVLSVLTGRGVPPREADQRVARLEAAYATWQATPEDRG